MKTKTSLKSAVLFLILLSGTALPAAAAPPPSAEEILAACSAFYGKLEGFQVHVESAQNTQSPDPTLGIMAVDRDRGFFCAMARPNKIALIGANGAAQGNFFISDGKTVATYRAFNHEYTSHPAPPKLSPLVTDHDTAAVISTFPNYLPLLTGADIAHESPHRPGWTYIGDETVAGQPAHHLRAVHDFFTQDLWIAAGEKPLLLKAAQTSSTPQKGASTPHTSVSTDTFSGWETDLPPPETFAIHRPADAVEGALFPGTETEPPPDLLNQPAPAFALKDLDGNAVSLASLKGRVVVLDFGPIRHPIFHKALPYIYEKAGALQDKGVVFYAVNGWFEADKIRPFLEDNGFSVPFLIDANQAVTKSYLAIPQSQVFLIDREGVIRAIYSNSRAATEPRFESDLEDLLAGKTLPPPLPPRPVHFPADRVVREEHKTSVQFLPPGKTPGTFAFSYSGAVATQQPVFPVTARVIIPGGKAVATLSVPDANPYTLTADLAPGSYWFELLPDKNSPYLDVIVNQLFIDGKGAATTTPNGLPWKGQFDRKIIPLNPAPSTVVSETRPVLKWEAVPGAVRYDVSAFAVEPGHSEHLFHHISANAAPEYAFPVDVLPNRKYEWSVWASDAGQRPIAQLTDYFFTPGGPERFAQAKPAGPQAMVGLHCSPTAQGWQVDMVTPGGPAITAGVLPQDILTRVNDQPLLNVKAWQEFTDMIHKLPIGQPAAFVLLRDGVEKTVQITPVASL